MRICHIIESAGGSAQVVVDLLKTNIAAGDKATLIYSPSRMEARYTTILDSMKGHVKLIPLPMRRKVGLHDIPDVWKLYRLIKKNGPFDVIHSHSSKGGALARMAGLFIPRAIQVYTPHAFMSMAPDASPVYVWIEWLLSWFTDAIICVSPQEYRHARDQLTISERKLHVIPNGIQLDYPADRETARAQMKFDDQHYIVGFVGRLVPQKNPLRLIDAFAQAAAVRPELHLAIIGDGALHNEIELAIKSYQLTGRVHFLEGWSGRDLMPGFDCFLCSSDYESFGLVIIEAMAAGIPVVTTPVGISEEAIIQGKTGFMTSNFDPKSLASAVVELAALDTAARERMIADIKAQAQRFSLERMGEQTRSLYMKLVA